jgi:hypothetical protein
MPECQHERVLFRKSRIQDLHVLKFLVHQPLFLLDQLDLVDSADLEPGLYFRVRTLLRYFAQSQLVLKRVDLHSPALVAVGQGRCYFEHISL